MWEGKLVEGGLLYFDDLVVLSADGADYGVVDAAG